MKKILALLLVIVFAVALFAGCGSNTTTTPSPSDTASAEPSTEPSTDPSTEPSAAETVKTGLGIVNSIAKSKSATADAEGQAEANSVIVALTIDSMGKITNCVIDQAQTKANFNASGEVTTALDATFKTKNELGTDYGMLKNSEIGKEWNEQAAAFAQYVVGKTVDEVKGIALDEEGHPTGSDLTASVSVHVNEFIAAIEKAAANAMDLGAMMGDTLSIATTTNIAKSKDATADAAGLIQVYSTYVAMTQAADGTITSCIFDASQSNVNFDTTGTITSDLTVAPMTKNELKEDYGMKKASAIGKEWYEQAAAFAAYVTGKTVAEVSGTAVTEDGHAGDEDLMASVTVHITDFIALVETAAA